MTDGELNESAADHGDQEPAVQEARIELRDMGKARIEQRSQGDDFGVRSIIGVNRPPLHGMASAEPVSGEAPPDTAPTPTESNQGSTQAQGGSSDGNSEK
jgi:hypothetical protein